MLLVASRRYVGALYIGWQGGRDYHYNRSRNSKKSVIPHPAAVLANPHQDLAAAAVASLTCRYCPSPNFNKSNMN